MNGVLSGEPTFFSSSALNGGSEQQRTYVLHPELVRQDWEDQFNNGAGDFNDFVAITDARVCGKGPFPIPASFEAGHSCLFDCTPTFGPNCAPKLVTTSQLKFFIGIGIDTTATEQNRESKGRAIHLTVSSYGTGAVTGRRFAVCPRLYFQPINNNKSTTDPLFKANYATNGAPACASAPVNNAIPYCSGPLSPSLNVDNVYPISFAREQLYTTIASCGSRKIDDTFVFQDDSVCNKAATSVNTENYEAYLSSLDAQIIDTNQRLGSASFAQLRDRLKYVNLLVVQDPPAKFYCPSGVNIQPGAINFTATGLAFEVSYPPNNVNIKVFERK